VVADALVPAESVPLSLVSTLLVVVTYEVDRWNLGLAHPGFMMPPLRGW
jgi:hypothetical protein